MKKNMRTIENKILNKRMLKLNIALNEMMLSHSLLNFKDWGNFHSDIQKIVLKYAPKYDIALDKWFKKHNKKVKI